MRAARMDQTRPALAVAKEDQVLAEDAHLARHAARVGSEADRVPVAAQQLAHRRAGADLGQLAVGGRRREAVGGALVHHRRRVGRAPGRPKPGRAASGAANVPVSAIGHRHSGFAPDALM